MIAADWEEILGPSQGMVPEFAEGEVVWRDDLLAGLAEAREHNRPLLITWRCIPCKQCADFDKSVLEGRWFGVITIVEAIRYRATDGCRSA